MRKVCLPVPDLCVSKPAQHVRRGVRSVRSVWPVASPVRDQHHSRFGEGLDVHSVMCVVLRKWTHCTPPSPSMEIDPIVHSTCPRLHSLQCNPSQSHRRDQAARRSNLRLLLCPRPCMRQRNFWAQTFRVHLCGLYFCCCSCFLAILHQARVGRARGGCCGRRRQVSRASLLPNDIPGPLWLWLARHVLISYPFS